MRQMQSGSITGGILLIQQTQTTTDEHGVNHWKPGVHSIPGGPEEGDRFDFELPYSKQRRQYWFHNSM